MTEESVPSSFGNNKHIQQLSKCVQLEQIKIVHHVLPGRSNKLSHQCPQVERQSSFNNLHWQHCIFLPRTCMRKVGPRSTWAGIMAQKRITDGFWMSWDSKPKCSFSVLTCKISTINQQVSRWLSNGYNSSTSWLLPNSWSRIPWKVDFELSGYKSSSVGLVVYDDNGLLVTNFLMIEYPNIIIQSMDCKPLVVDELLVNPWWFIVNDVWTARSQAWNKRVVSRGGEPGLPITNGWVAMYHHGGWAMVNAWIHIKQGASLANHSAPPFTGHIPVPSQPFRSKMMCFWQARIAISENPFWLHEHRVSWQ